MFFINRFLFFFHLFSYGFILLDVIFKSYSDIFFKIPFYKHTKLIRHFFIENIHRQLTQCIYYQLSVLKLPFVCIYSLCNMSIFAIDKSDHMTYIKTHGFLYTLNKIFISYIQIYSFNIRKPPLQRPFEPVYKFIRQHKIKLCIKRKPSCFS